MNKYPARSTPDTQKTAEQQQWEKEYKRKKVSREGFLRAAAARPATLSEYTDFVEANQNGPHKAECIYTPWGSSFLNHQFYVATQSAYLPALHGALLLSIIDTGRAITGGATPGHSDVCHMQTGQIRTGRDKIHLPTEVIDELKKRGYSVERTGIERGAACVAVVQRKPGA